MGKTIAEKLKDICSILIITMSEKIKNFLKLLTLLLTLSLTISGCDKNSSPEDIIKIVSDEHSLIKEYSAFQIENAMNEGVINLRAGNIQEAIHILEKVVTYYPTNSAGHFHLGRAYYANNEISKFLYHTKQAFLLDNTLVRELSGPVIGKNVIGRVFVTDRVEKEKNIALTPMVWFDKNIPFIYASLEIINAPPDTEIEAELVYELSKNERLDVNSVLFKTTGSENTAISVKKPSSGWPAGKYRLNIFVNGAKNIDLTFYIF